ncbi:NUDIX domain-containing protein [Actinomycetospora aeridis]|uniref:NUDIX domain-containing protein n=1 Tax=Actinomycetospora aeridis TaxID=3129231 RepID=A0ABU8N099_9PSEU
MARRHVTVHLDGDAARAVDALRADWDPAMLRICPAHVSVVYPEETVDEALLLERLEEAARETAPFAVRLGGVEADEDGAGGVFAMVEDGVPALETLRDRLLLPPQGFAGHPFHATIAHPRTSPSPATCWSRVRGGRLDATSTVHEVLWTVTDDVGREVLARFPLTGPATAPRVAMAAGVLVDGGRVLLGLRRADRASFPGVWDLPGGRVEPGESPRGAARRELREELGVDAELGAPWRRLVDDDLGAELSLWLVPRFDGGLRNAAPHEHERLAWFGADELPALELAHPSYVRLLTDAL